MSAGAGLAADCTRAGAGSTGPRAVALQLQVLSALILREVRAAFGRSRLGYLWALLVPCATIAMLVVLFTLIDRQAPIGPSLALFFATGILTLDHLSRLSHSLLHSFAASRGLLAYPRVQRLDVVLARAALIIATYALITGLVAGALIALGHAPWPAAPLRLLGAFAATALLGVSLGLCHAVAAARWDAWPQVERIMMRPMFLLSGVFYLPMMLPAQVQAVLWWNPIVHLVEWARSGWYPAYVSAHLSPAYPLSVALALLVTGLLAERATRSRPP